MPQWKLDLIEKKKAREAAEAANPTPAPAPAPPPAPLAASSSAPKPALAAPVPPPATPVAEMASSTIGDPLEPYTGKCIVLWTSYASNQLFEVAWRKIETQLQSKGVDYVPVDGAAPPNKELRSALWAISGQRTYPQVFIYAGEKCAFIGSGDELQELFDAGGYSSVFRDYLGKKNWDPGTPRGEM